jgi:hypothetical protein
MTTPAAPINKSTASPGSGTDVAPLELDEDGIPPEDDGIPPDDEEPVWWCPLSLPKIPPKIPPAMAGAVMSVAAPMMISVFASFTSLLPFCLRQRTVAVIR